MKLATIDDGSRDGALVVVSADHRRAVAAGAVAESLQSALDEWDDVAPRLAELSRRLAGGESSQAFDFDPLRACAPLPRCWQWLDGSAFPSHGVLMQRAFNLPPIESDAPLMYQGISHVFLPGHADVPLPSAEDGIDFEGEFAVITDAVPMGCTAAAARPHIKLIVLLNDWSLRRIAPIEMQTGFGWIQAKPACSVAPIAITPDELGPAWHGSRVHAALRVDRGAERFGRAHGGAMAFGFDELIAHGAATRDFCAGTIVGSGTVSNAEYRDVGSSCIAERRAIEMIEHGTPRTPFLHFGERIRMEVLDDAGHSLFGVIDQRVIRRAGGPW